MQADEIMAVASLKIRCRIEILAGIVNWLEMYDENIEASWKF